MNTVMEAILTRRSIRKFTDKPVPEEELMDILKAATYAPSGKNQQTWQFTAITNPQMIQKLIKAMGEVLENSDYTMYHPTAIILPSNLKDSPWGKEDNSCALENIFLAAHSYGIGSVWINQLQGNCDKPAIREILRECGVPENHVIYGLAALGYAADPAPTEVTKKGVIKLVK